MTDKLEIDTAACNCPERGKCYHIGALALNTGFETPIFSYQCSSNNEDSDDSDSSECAPQPLQEVYVKCEPLDPIASEPTDTLDISRPLNMSQVRKSATYEVLIVTRFALKQNRTGPDRSSDNPKSGPSSESRKSHCYSKLMNSNCLCLICDKIYENEKQLEVCVCMRPTA